MMLTARAAALPRPPRAAALLRASSLVKPGLHSLAPHRLTEMTIGGLPLQQTSCTGNAQPLVLSTPTTCPRRSLHITLCKPTSPQRPRGQQCTARAFLPSKFFLQGCLCPKSPIVRASLPSKCSPQGCLCPQRRTAKPSRPSKCSLQACRCPTRRTFRASPPRNCCPRAGRRWRRRRALRASPARGLPLHRSLYPIKWGTLWASPPRG
mmetsp:Transcript_146246/g.364698  ORF Transcript_146246/g.364698 Transcript_146246/m.364698 type:complete len:208 (-) Transcript_146246:207-830(-)